MILIVSLFVDFSVLAQETGEFLTPPPTVDDITAILDQQKLDNPEEIAAARKLAASEPPKTRSKKKLAKFYHQRAHAAYSIGNARQEIADYALAASYYKDNNNLSLVIGQQGMAEARAGSWIRAIKVLTEAADVAKKNRDKPQRMLSPLTLMAFLYSELGELELAEEYLAEAYRYKKRIHNLQYWNNMGKASLVNVFERTEAMMLESQGHLAESEALFRKCLARWEQYKDESWDDKRWQKNIPLRRYTWLLSLLSDNLLKQGRLLEAEVYSREAVLEALKVSGRNSDHTIDRMGELIRAIFEQGRYDEAEQLSRIAVETLENLGAAEDSYVISEARRDLANILVAQEQWESALAVYDRVRKGLENDPETYRSIFAFNLDWATALIKTGKLQNATEMLEPAYLQSVDVLGKKHYDSAETGAYLALAYLASGNQTDALKLFGASIPILLQRSRRSDNTRTTRVARTQRLQIIIEGYIELLWQLHDSGQLREIEKDPAAEAFYVADAIRGQSVQQALSASAARTAARDPALSGLVRAEQDSLRQIGALNGLLTNLLSIPTSNQNPDTIRDLRERIDRLRDKRSEQSDAIMKKFPEYARLVNPSPVTTTEVAALLDKTESMIATFVGSQRTYIWAISGQGKTSFAAANLGQRELSEKIALLRRALDPAAESLDDIPDFDLETGYTLYRELLEPLRYLWQESDSLIVINHGPLAHIPLGLLPVESVSRGAESDGYFSGYREIPWLIRSHALTVLPSVTAFSILRKVGESVNERRKFVGFGDPIFSREQLKLADLPDPSLTRTRGIKLRALPKTRNAQLAQLPRLPGTAQEVISIARVLNADPATDIFLGLDANEENVKSTALSGYEVLAFATHGLVAGDLDGLYEPALALSDPQLSEVEGDGLLTLSEIMQLELDADWVILSACNTATGDGAGSEAISGLGRAFFYAGTRALLVSYWPVETTSAREITTDLFYRQSRDPNISRSKALQQTMVSLIDGPGYVDQNTGETIFSYAHPIFWAPFSLIGEGGR